MLVDGKHYRTVWIEKNIVKMINQPLIPHFFKIISSKDHKETADHIKNMTVRGAGAIGATGGYGMAQAALEAPDNDFMPYIDKAADTLRNTRPTAQNLFYAIERVYRMIDKHQDSPYIARKKAVEEAQAIADEDANSCRKIGEHGNALIKDGMRIETHCNAGWLAFVDWGSAISPIYKAKRDGKKVYVFVDTTGPRNQGSRLTAWELVQEQIEHRVIADNAGAHYMQRGEVDMIITGADRIARNGDTANKIGTLDRAIVAKHFGIPFYIAAPTSTFDIHCASGKDIPIEERNDDEVLFARGLMDDGEFGKVRIAPKESKGRNPAFDYTPAELITGIITEKGIIRPTEEEIMKLFPEVEKN